MSVGEAIDKLLVLAVEDASETFNFERIGNGYRLTVTLEKVELVEDDEM